MTTVFILAKQQEAQERGMLNIWTVYDHPIDFPNSYVARRFEIGPKGAKPTADIVQGDISIIRESFRRCGLTRLIRNEGDDPKVMECWL